MLDLPLWTAGQEVLGCFTGRLQLLAAWPGGQGRGQTFTVQGVAPARGPSVPSVADGIVRALPEITWIN